MTGSGRLPGSRYSISEVEINDCATPAQLKSLVAKNKDTGRGGGGCCGCSKATLLSQWKYLEGKELQGELEGEFATRDALKEQQPSLEAYLGVKPEDPALAAPCHSNRMLLNEDGMVYGAALHAQLLQLPPSTRVAIVQVGVRV